MTSTATAAPQSRQAGRLGLSRYLGYAGGDVANNLTFSLASMFLLLYYTDVAGIAAGAAGTLLLVVRVWQAVTDISPVRWSTRPPPGGAGSAPASCSAGRR